ncbi:hypothetical protein GUITHDRAFT_151158 [Guillardia theta CCMP2712]|uniref:RWP-RK domain-containing protein n=1 Tax=Guillardia theta (strain CCMP2712) TaxID=905079 RepID=L1JQK8_GUITC|nr:hypothetical protein GUITHDRAFT_151158 [Guillardia theta CCMP2712]EKX50470.1 hypothetical protein GUITHDRAFT_151158 [Guillardia theta CCMP2712]|eukprot:XP_005837450.1 hypothetical protein GUITHDRAFT_151158 [Guillardia theta CCMP2712]
MSSLRQLLSAATYQLDAQPLRVKVCPRPRGKPSTYSPVDPINLDLSSVRSLFHLTQTEAAETLGISLSSLKSACRRMGIRKWPYNRRSQCTARRNKGESNGSPMPEREPTDDDSLSSYRKPYWTETSIEELLEESLMHVMGHLSR